MYNVTSINSNNSSFTDNIPVHRHIYDNNRSCILCGKKEISTGKIFKGFCVCEDCVEYVCTETDSNIPA